MQCIILILKISSEEEYWHHYGRHILSIWWLYKCIIFMYRSLTFPYWHTCQCMHDLVYETINMKKKPCDMILFLFKPSINEHTWHYPIELLHLYYWWNRSLIVMILKLDRSLSVSEDSNVWTVSVGFAPTRPSVENRKNQQVRSHIHECI